MFENDPDIAEGNKILDSEQEIIKDNKDNKGTNKRTLKLIILIIIVVILIGAIVACLIIFLKKDDDKKEEEKNKKLIDINLVKPREKGGKNILELFSIRKTERDFKQNKELTFEQLSEIMWDVYGPNRENGHKTVPSAMAMYPLIFYVFRAKGVYKYDPDNYKLIHLLNSDHRNMTGGQNFVKDASINIVILANYTKECPKGRNCDEAYRFKSSLLDASHSSQNIYLNAASEGLKWVEREFFKEDVILNILGIKNDYKVVITLSVGH